MIDPISCVALASGALKTLKSAVSVGRDLQDCSSQLISWGRAMSDFTNCEEREKNPPFGKKLSKEVTNLWRSKFLPRRKKWKP